LGPLLLCLKDNTVFARECMFKDKKDDDDAGDHDVDDDNHDDDGGNDDDDDDDDDVDDLTVTVSRVQGLNTNILMRSPNTVGPSVDPIVQNLNI